MRAHGLSECVARWITQSGYTLYGSGTADVSGNRPFFSYERCISWEEEVVPRHVLSNFGGG